MGFLKSILWKFIKFINFNPLFELILLVLCNVLWLKDYFIRYKHCKPSFFFSPFSWNTFFYPFTLICVYLLFWSRSLVYSIWVLFSYPFNYPKLSFYDFIYLFIFREREGREKERERNIYVSGNTDMLPLIALQPGTRPSPQPRHVPWLRFEVATFQFVGWGSTNWAMLVMASLCLLIGAFKSFIF